MTFERQRRTATSSLVAAVDYSIVVPAFNEEAFLPKTLLSLKEAMEPIPHNGEVIVVDNNSYDATAELAREHSARVVFEEHRQIARSRNAGAQKARGRWLIFVDADTQVSQRLLQRALAELESGRCVGGGSLVCFDEDLRWPATVLLNFWNYIALRRGLAAGSFVYCLKSAWQETGGFSERVYASEEIWFSLSLQSWGRKQEPPLSFTIIEDAPLITSNRKAHWYSPSALVFQFLLLIVFPFGIFSRRFCSVWYDRSVVNRKGREGKDGSLLF